MVYSANASKTEILHLHSVSFLADSCNAQINSQIFQFKQDDGTSRNTEAVLGVLKETGIRATFFLNGVNFENINDQSTHDKMKRIIQEVITDS